MKKLLYMAVLFFAITSCEKEPIKENLLTSSDLELNTRDPYPQAPMCTNSLAYVYELAFPVGDATHAICFNDGQCINIDSQAANELCAKIRADKSNDVQGKFELFQFVYKITKGDWNVNRDPYPLEPYCYNEVVTVVENENGTFDIYWYGGDVDYNQSQSSADNICELVNWK